MYAVPLDLEALASRSLRVLVFGGDARRFAKEIDSVIAADEGDHGKGYLVIRIDLTTMQGCHGYKQQARILKIQRRRQLNAQECLCRISCHALNDTPHYAGNHSNAKYTHNPSSAA